MGQLGAEHLSRRSLQWDTVKNQNVDDQTEAAGARSMNTGSKDKILSGDGSGLATAEQRLRQLGIKLPTPPEPFGIYAEAVQTGNLLFLTGMLPTVGREAKFIGRIGAELDVQTGRQAAYLAALNAPRCRAAAFGIARQSYADRPARRVGGHFGRCPGAAENR